MDLVSLELSLKDHLRKLQKKLQIFQLQFQREYMWNCEIFHNVILQSKKVL